MMDTKTENKASDVNGGTEMMVTKTTMPDKMDTTSKTEKSEKTKEVTIKTEDLPGTSSSSDMAYSQELAARRRQFMSQPSTVATRRQQAVCVRRAHKSYGPKKNPNVVLDGLNMTVPMGSMYVIAI